MEDITKSKCYIRLKLAIKVSFVVNVVLAVSLPCLYIAHRINDSNVHLQVPSTFEQSQVDKIPQFICLSCSYFNNQTDMENQSLYDIVSSSNGHHLCCIKDLPKFQTIIIEMLEENHQGLYQNSTQVQKEMTEDRMQWWRERDFSAHLYLDEIKDKNLSWRADNSFGTGFIRNLTLLPGESKVRLTSPNGGNGEGMFFIYSQITLTIKISKHTEYFKGIHAIRKSNQEMTNIRPWSIAERHFEGNRTFGYLRSFLCVTERLTTDETIDITIDVSPGSDYNIDGKFYNYFGMFKL